MKTKFITEHKTYSIDVDTVNDIIIEHMVDGTDSLYNVIVATSKGNYAGTFLTLHRAQEGIQELVDAGISVSEYETELEDDHYEEDYDEEEERDLIREYEKRAEDED